MLVSEALQQWFRKRSRAWCPAHRGQMERFVRGWVASFGDREVGAVVVADVERHEMGRDDGERSASALNQERTYLRGFFKWCALNGWRTGDPTVTWVFRKSVVKREYVELDRAQEEALVAECPPWLQLFVRVGICTGLREGTVRQLTWEMLHGDELVVPGPTMKGREPLRVPLAPRLREALGAPGTGLIFPNMPDASSLYRAFKRAAKRAGLPAAVSPHDLRRTFVSRLTEAGKPLQTIMVLGAWKTPGVLLKHYASKLTKNAAMDAVSQI